MKPQRKKSRKVSRRKGSLYDENILNEVQFAEHKPFGWWYSPKYKPTQDGFFVGFKESIDYVKKVLITEVSISKTPNVSRCQMIVMLILIIRDLLMVYLGFLKVK